MADYFLPLIKEAEIAKDTWAFEFAKPKKFIFKPGQTVDVTVGTMIYTFSIAASPNESILRIAMRMRKESKFKQALKKIKPGQKVRIQGPSGDFVLPQNTKKRIILVAGGIGITPFYSMIMSHPKHKISLFYKNSSPSRSAFLDELKTLGIIHSELVIDRKALYYIAGPPGFVTKYHAILDSKGINDDNIRTEEFSGY